MDLKEVDEAIITRLIKSCLAPGRVRNGNSTDQGRITLVDAVSNDEEGAPSYCEHRGWTFQASLIECNRKH